MMGCGLEGICLFEKDFSGEVVRTWTLWGGGGSNNPEKYILKKISNQGGEGE